jgi:hypothetical protein
MTLEDMKVAGKWTSEGSYTRQVLRRQHKEAAIPKGHAAINFIKIRFGM